MAEYSKGSSAHAAQHQHGVVPRQAPPNPQTVEQRVARLESRVDALETAKAVEREAKAPESLAKKVLD